MNKSLYVGNLPYDASEDDIRSAFSAHGQVHSVKVVTDRETGRPRGFAFVEMSEGDAESAVKAMNGKDFGGRALRVNEANERAPRSGGGGGGGGGYGGGGGGGYRPRN
jgi:RNA recognition motif-containing protein